MEGVVLISFCCIMFIHLGLGETICKIIHLDFILFRCQKCLNFWAVLGYSLLVVNLPVLESLALAFSAAYCALWADLVLAKLAEKYDYWYTENEDLEAEQPSGAEENDSPGKNNQDKEGEDRRMS